MENEIIKEKKDWVSRFYIAELVLFVIGGLFLLAGYKANHLLFSIIGCIVMIFGMIMAFIEKKK